MTGSSKTNSVPTMLRLIKLMQLIPRQQAGFKRRIGTAELEDKLRKMGFNISRRTLQRDLKNLEQAFPALRNDGHREALGWYWEEDTIVEHIPAMDYTLAFSFKLLDKLLTPSVPAITERLKPYVAAANSILPRAWKHGSEQVVVISRSMPLQPVVPDPTVIDAVFQALATRRRFRARYRRRDGEVAEYVLNPLGLVLRHEVAYLVATAWDYDDPRHYALHRFDKESMDILTEDARMPEGFDLGDYVRRGGFQYLRSQKPLRLVLRMDADTAVHLAETPLADDQTMSSPDKSNEVRIRATVADTEQLRWWILGLGDKVKVESPKKLREEISGLLERSLARYAD